MHINVTAEAYVAPFNPPTHLNEDDGFVGLITRIRPILTGLARKMSGGDFASEADFFQTGLLGAWEAFQAHDTSAGKLEHFAVHCARRQMLKRLRWLFSRRHEVSAGDFITRDSDTNLSAIELEAQEQLAQTTISYRLCDAVDCAVVWEIAVVELTSREFAVMRLLYCGDLLPSEAAKELGISQPRVTQLVKSALAKLRAAIVTPFSLN